MKRTFSILAIFSILTLTIFYSCRSEGTENTETVTSTESLYNKKESTLLQKRYGFISVSNYIDKSNNFDFNNIKSSTKFVDNSFDSNDLDLSKVTETKWDDSSISYIIPFKKSTTKFLVVSVKPKEKLDVEKGVVVENFADAKGNGTIIYTTNDGKTELEFANGIQQNSTTLYGRTFRECFDQAYNDICDGFIGCVAWYSNPQVPLVAAAYCQIHG